MSYQAIKDLVGYAHRTGLIEECERVWAENTLLHAMGLEAWEEPQAARAAAGGHTAGAAGRCGGAGADPRRRDQPRSL